MSLLSSLTNRIFLASAALTVLLTGAAIYVVNARVTASAENELRLGLVQTGEVVEQQRGTVSDSFRVLARAVADLPKLKAAVDTRHPPTVQPIAADYQRQLGSDLLIVTDADGHTLAVIGPAASEPRDEMLPPIRDAAAGRERSTFWPRPDGVLQVVSVPISAGASPPDIVGTLSLGFLLNDRLAKRLKDLTGSEIAFAAGGRIRASTLPAADRTALEPLLQTEGVTHVTVGGNDYLALSRPLATAPGTSLIDDRTGPHRAGDPGPDEDSRAMAVILRSRTDRLRFLRPIQTALLATGFVAVLLAIVLGYAVARTITHPLAAITTTMREMAATGDLTRRVAWTGSRWDDEDARLLARTFTALTDSITRFQREATERERLSALGRLSTVIAHEVRNPLMIIKASLRPLQAGSAPPAEIREAAADIDGEVTRLNRLINEVLDFARPLRLDLALTDVNRLCEESALAAAADGAEPSIGLALDRSLPPILADPGHLRSALVNILVNARQAVTARRSEPGTPPESPPAAAHPAVAPDVQVTTGPGQGGGVAIVVRDRGVGIHPADLARVFEPYFTTKRSGTGLGLAIARNIIEALGGSIGIESTPGVSTAIRIELPARSDTAPGAPEDGPRGVGAFDSTNPS